MPTVQWLELLHVYTLYVHTLYVYMRAKISVFSTAIGVHEKLSGRSGQSLSGSTYEHQQSTSAENVDSVDPSQFYTSSSPASPSVHPLYPLMKDGRTIGMLT